MENPYTKANSIEFQIHKDLKIQDLEVEEISEVFRNFSVLEFINTLNYLRTIQSSIELLILEIHAAEQRKPE